MAFNVTWDEDTKRYYETGTRRVVLYPKDTEGYGDGVGWSGVTAISETPSGGEETALYANDDKYVSLRSKEEYGGTIEAYTYPDEWAECDGSAYIDGNTKGVKIGQQGRKTFGLCYRTKISNDVDADDYLLHFVYGCTASPSERSYTTINDSPEAITFSWEFTTVPIEIDATGYEDKKTSIVIVDSRKYSKAKMAALENLAYGTGSTKGKLPTPAEILTALATPDPTGQTGSTGSTGSTS